MESEEEFQLKMENKREEFQFFKSSRKTDQFNWNIKWIIPFESPWSILEKFKYANVASTNDVFQIFGVEKTKKKSYNWGKIERNLITMDSLNEFTLSEILGTDIKNNFLNDLEQVLGFLPNKYAHKTYINPNLTYCPDCMNNGFHCIFHQLSLFTHCPYHNKLLISHCEVCHNVIPYALNDKWGSKPFKCKCGHSLINENDFLSVISKWGFLTNLKIQNKHLLTWLGLDINTKTHR